MDANPGHDDQPNAAATADETPPRRRSLGPLRMVWRELFNYPGRMVTAGLALVTTATSTLAIPYGFRQIIDRRFAAGADPSVIRCWLLSMLGVGGVPAVAHVIAF